MATEAGTGHPSVIGTGRKGPYGVCISPDLKHLVATFDNHTVGVYLVSDGTELRSFGGEGSAEGQFRDPRDVCMGESDSIVVADHGNNRVQELTLDGVFRRSLGQGSLLKRLFGGSDLNQPSGVCVRRSIDTLAVVESGRHCVHLLRWSDGTSLCRIGSEGDGVGRLRSPWSVTFVDDTRLAVADQGNHRVSLFRTDGTFCHNVGLGQLFIVHGVARLPSGNLAVVDCGHRRLVELAAETVETVETAGAGVIREWQDDSEDTSRFTNPFGVDSIAVEGERALVCVADRDNARLVLFDVSPPPRSGV